MGKKLKKFVAKDEKKVSQAVSSLESANPVEPHDFPWLPRTYKVTMCTQLVELMEKGRGVESFTSKNNIARQTFYKWVDKYPEFKIAYYVGNEKAKEFMTSLLREHTVYVGASKDESGSPRVDIAVWKALMKHSLAVPDTREIYLEDFDPASAPKTQMSIVLKAMAEGILTTQEAHKIAELIEIGQRVAEFGELTRRIEELETALESGAKIDDFKQED